MAIDLALTPDGSWSVTLDDLAAAASGAGFAATGVGAGLVDANSAATLAAHNLRCHELLALMISRNPEKTLQRAAELAAAAASIEAEWVLANFTAPIDDQIAETIRQAASILKHAGTKLAIEFSPLGAISSIAAGEQILEIAGADRAGVMIDTWHFTRGDSTWEQLEQIPLEHIAYVQFDDALPAESDDGMFETMHRRAFPGEGEFELERFAATLRDRGWEGTVSIEVLSDDGRQLSVPEFCKRAYTSAARYWS